MSWCAWDRQVWTSLICFQLFMQALMSLSVQLGSKPDVHSWILPGPVIRRDTLIDFLLSRCECRRQVGMGWPQVKCMCTGVFHQMNRCDLQMQSFTSACCQNASGTRSLSFEQKADRVWIAFFFFFYVMHLNAALFFGVLWSIDRFFFASPFDMHQHDAKQRPLMFNFMDQCVCVCCFVRLHTLRDVWASMFRMTAENFLTSSSSLSSISSQPCWYNLTHLDWFGGFTWPCPFNWHIVTARNAATKRRNWRAVS